MKRYGNLWHDLASFANLLNAFHKARDGKRRRPAVVRFEERLEWELADLQNELEAGSYRPGAFREFTIRDPKPRLISVAPFRDRVVHHALCNVLEPIFERSFIHDSYACRAYKGTHAAVARYQHFARGRRYVLKCDIRKYFPSVDHAILNGLLARKIKDARVRSLAALMVAHSNEQEPVPGFFPGDDLLTRLDRPRGLPIGNQTSQFFANVFLDPFDHFVQESLPCRAFVRYCDDFVLLSNDPKQLAQWREAIEAFLLGMRLWLHPKKRTISRTVDGIRFLGYRAFPDYRKLDVAGVRRFKKRLKAYQGAYARGELEPRDIAQRINGWLEHACHAKSFGLQRQLLERTVFVRPNAD